MYSKGASRMKVYQNFPRKVVEPGKDNDRIGRCLILCIGIALVAYIVLHILFYRRIFQ